MRHGYNRITIEDIAREAGIGKGTVYLHWRTKEALFGSLFLREAVAIWRRLLERVRADPEEVLLHRVMRSLLPAVLERPLARALFTGDRELLGRLAERAFGESAHPQRAILEEEALALLRDRGLLRSDTSLALQRYALGATVRGFLQSEASLSAQDALSPAERAEALAWTVRRAFEPDEPPRPQALAETAAKMIRWLEQLCAGYERQMQAGRSDAPAAGRSESEGSP